VAEFLGMRTWGKPGASIPRRGKAHHAEEKQPERVSYFIEYAPEDKRYADAIVQGLTRHGHPQVADGEQAQASFAIISRYKDNISVDPQKHVVYPVIIQDTRIDDEDLQRIQWIDFRSGLKNLDQLARLLPHPEKLLRALGVIPISQQTIYPRIIQMMDYYLILLGFFTFSVWIPLSFEFGKQFVQLRSFPLFVLANIIFKGIILRSIFLSRRALVTRTGKNASPGRLIGTLLWVGFINFLQTLLLLRAVMAATEPTGIILQNDLRGSVTLFLPMSFSMGFILICVLGLFNWRELTRWFPYREKH